MRRIDTTQVADREEDDVRAGNKAPRAAVVPRKAELEVTRVHDYATLVRLVRSRA